MTGLAQWLTAKYTVNFYLSPDEIGIFRLRNFDEPKAFFHQRANQITVVSRTNKHLYWQDIAAEVKLTIDLIRQVDHEEKLPKFLKTNFKTVEL